MVRGQLSVAPAPAVLLDSRLIKEEYRDTINRLSLEFNICYYFPTDKFFSKKLSQDEILDKDYPCSNTIKLTTNRLRFLLYRKRIYIITDESGKAVFGSRSMLISNLRIETLKKQRFNGEI